MCVSEASPSSVLRVHPACSETFTERPALTGHKHLSLLPMSPTTLDMFRCETFKRSSGGGLVSRSAAESPPRVRNCVRKICCLLLNSLVHRRLISRISLRKDIWLINNERQVGRQRSRLAPHFVHVKAKEVHVGKETKDEF